jgi:hypothetical protein
MCNAINIFFSFIRNYNYHLQDFFHDLDPTISLSKLYSVIEMDSTWTQWTRLQEDALKAFTTTAHGSSTVLGIKVHGRPYTSNDLSVRCIFLLTRKRYISTGIQQPSALLLVKNRKFK